MLRARTGNRLIFGLSARNVEKLMDGYPIQIDVKASGESELVIILFYGKTEDDMKAALEEAGIELPEVAS